MEDPKRIYFLDTLRAFIIFLVIVLHVCLVFAVPPFPGWVHDPAPEANYINTIVAIFDGPMLMTVMFFLAGYFTLGSFAKKSPRQFITDKLVRIGIPWVIGATLIACIQAEFGYYSNGGDWGGIKVVSIPTFFQWIKAILIFFQHQYYTQFHFWFLGVLLWLFVITALVLTIFKSKIDPVKTKSGKPSLLFLILFTALTTGLFFVTSLPASFYTWTSLYIIQFQNMVFPVYIAYFILGMYAFKRNWFKDGYRPKLLPWAIIYLIAITTHVMLYKMTYFFNPLTVIPKLISSITMNVTIISWLFMLLALFQKFFNRGGAAQQVISQSSYSVYIIHLIFIFIIAYVFRGIALPKVPKYLIEIVLVTLVSWGIGYVLKKTPGLRKAL